MENRKTFSKESPIYVATSSKLNLEQTLHVTREVLGLVGCPTCFSGFKFQFIDEGEMISARIGVDNQLNVSAL